jgi:hypothetical protein
MDTLINLYQGRIRQAQTHGDLNRNSMEEMRSDIEDLQRKTDALTIACQAMWEIIRTQTNISDDMIVRKMQEVDARDGRVDGKMSLSLSECPQCGRKSNASRGTCLYCGTPLPTKHVV